MPVPTQMSDLSLTAASNSPAGSDSVGNTLDDYLRAQAALLRSTNALATAAIASAATVDVGAANAESVSITGTTTITSLGTGFAGCYRELRFAGALILTHSASLLLPGATNITTVANDVYSFRCLSAGVWVMVGGSRASGTLVSPSITGTATYNGIEIGFRGIPLATQNTNYTFAAGDKGKGIVKGSGDYTYTVNNGIHSTGDVITVVNTGTTGSITLAEGAGVTLRKSGTATTGNFTVAPGGVVTLLFVSTSAAIVGGTALS